MPTSKRAGSQSKKRLYRTPRLKTHGNLKTLTLAKGGANGDGVGKPKTRVATGGPG